MVYRLLASILILAFLGLAEAQPRDRDMQEDLDKRANRRPNPRIVALLREMKDDIKILGEKYGVDPRAIAGTILAENTMNSGLDEQVQTWLASRGHYSLMGRKFSFGLGQLYDFSAVKSEKTLAKLDRREERSLALVRRDMLSAEGSLYYVTGTIKNVQDVYTDKGFKVADDPLILTTLYNIGRPKDRADRRIKMTGKPEPNYFGRFVKNNLGVIEEAIDYGTPPEPKSLALSPLSFDEQVAQKRYPVLSENLTLPKRMSTRFYHRIYDWYKKLPSEYELTGTYRVVGRNVDGRMSPWVLIEDEQGNRGWVSEEKLTEKTYPGLRKIAFKCSSQEQVCMESISKIAGNKVLEKDKGLVLVDFAGTNSNLQTYYPHFHPLCLMPREHQQEYLRMHGVKEKLPLRQSKWVFGQAFDHGFDKIRSLGTAYKARQLDKAKTEGPEKSRSRGGSPFNFNKFSTAEGSEGKASIILKLFKRLLSGCTNPELGNHLSRVIHYDVLTRQPQPELMEVDAQSLEAFAKKCEAISKLRKQPAEAPFACELSHGGPNHQAQVTKVVQSMDKELEKALLFEYLDLFAAKKELENVDCLYDPSGSAKMVKGLSDLECVDLVTVPDGFLSEVSGGPRAKIKVDPSSRRGVAIRLAPLCEKEKK